jgi:hypothetical protein
MILRDPPSDEADVAAAARAAGWTLPRSIAALACSDEDLAALSRALPDDALATVFEETGCALVPDPGARAAEIEAATAGVRAAIGPTLPVALARRSWRLARGALRAVTGGAIAADGPVRAEDRLIDLLVFENPAIGSVLAAKRLAPLESLTPKARARMRETALTYVRHAGNAVAMAEAMHVHPQTARYRVARLRELLGDALDDPEARLEIELALRVSGSEPAAATR